MNPKICAIVLNYFGYEDTIDCIRSLLEEKTVVKIIVVENSADEIELTALTEEFQSVDRIVILSSRKNLGFASGINFALTAVGVHAFEAFLILNNDTLIPANSISHLCEGLVNSRFDLVAPIIRCYPEKDKIWSKGSYYNMLAGLITARDSHVLPFSFFYLTGCCLLVRAHVFETMGLFDEAFFMYGEDVEFCFRAMKWGFEFDVIPTAEIYHKGSKSSVMNSVFYEHYMNKAHFLLSIRLIQSRYGSKLSFVTKSLTLFLRALWRTFKYQNLNALVGFKLGLHAYLFERPRIRPIRPCRKSDRCMIRDRTL